MGGMDLQRVKVSELKFYPGNPRRIDKETLERLKWSIQEFGIVEPLVINSKRQVIGGNQRLKALRELGIEEVDCILVDLPIEKEKALNLALNKITGEWDIELLKNFIIDIDNTLLEMVGFDSKEIEVLTEVEEYTEGEDEVPDVEEKAFTQEGDLWLLGRHRLLCGDATKKEDVEKLMNGEKADMVFTDPPYNVNYTGGPPGEWGRKVWKKIKGDKMNDKDYSEFIASFLVNCIKYTKSQAPFYMCFGDKNIHIVRKVWDDAGLYLSSTIIWYKINHFVATGSDYQKAYEPILYGWKRGERHYWCGDRTQTDVWEVARNMVNKYHPTQKPIELIVRAIKNSSKGENMIYDPFCGSGSTFIACEKTGRTCYGMEIDPHYCDVIVKRYINFTHREDVTLIRNDKELSYSEIKEQLWI